MLLSELEEIVRMMRIKAKDEDPHVLFHELESRDQRCMTISLPYEMRSSGAIDRANLLATVVMEPFGTRHGEPLEVGDYVFNIVPFEER